MTEQEKREKVIEGLKELQSHFRALAGISSSKQGRANHIESARTIGDAITLLKTQEPNEDWISRKRLRNEIQYYIDEANWGDEANKVLGWCLEFIDNQKVVNWNDA